MKILIILFSLSFVTVCWGQESKSEISKYSGDGVLEYLPAPGLLGIDGIKIRFPSFDLSKDFNTTYSLQNLPAGDPFMVYFVVPVPAPLREIERNNIHLIIFNNGKIVREINLPIGSMINNQGRGLNRYYSLKDFRNHQISSQIDADQEGNHSIKLIYENSNLSRETYGYLLLERGGFK